MSEPRSPGSVIGDSAEAGDQGRSILDIAVPDHGGGLMDDGLVEPRASTPCLIDQISGDPLAHEIGEPAFPPVRCRLQTCRCMRGPVYHDDWWHLRFLARRNLELHIHLA